MSDYVDDLLNRSLREPVERFAARRGKRIRFGLMQASYQFAGGHDLFPEALGEAVEWLHAGSLVIDDIQDNSDTRRGRPTMHRHLGVPLAINAGNWMYFSALEILTDAPLPQSTRSALVEAMVRAGRKCHEGQALDLAVTVDETPAEYWIETARLISRLKTGTLVELAATMGSIAAGGSTRLVTSLARFGRDVGTALQMRNDLDELATFTVRDDDLRGRRMTWPWAWAAELHGAASVGPLQNRLAEAASLARSGQPDSLHAIAAELLELVADAGDRRIAEVVERSIRLLAEHVVDQDGIRKLEQLLSPISTAGAADKTRAALPAKTEVSCVD
jgi:geranylgeranyl pyrophosphate synthase